MTFLAVPIAADSLDEARTLLAQAEQSGAELIELRLDLLPPGAAQVLILLAKVPVLATCRDKAEGGRFDGDDARAEVLRQALAAGATVVDFELAAWNRSKSARDRLSHALGSRTAGGPLRILSAHDFAGPPTDLNEFIDTLLNSPADVIKLAYKADRITDSFAALDLLVSANKASKRAVALAMGEAGVITRLLAKKLGAFLTFAAAGQGQGTAPGQPTIREIKELYRWDSVGPATRLFGVIGNPIAHSMSPAIHNAAFAAAGYDGLYVPLLVEPEAATFNGLLDGIRQRNDWLDFRGLSVTLPHKENALRYLQDRRGKIEPLARRIGAVNTIRFDPDGTLAGRNTDYAAAVDAVCDGLGIKRRELADRSVAVLGAGGAARAIVAGFTDAGAYVTIMNRTLSRAEALAEEFGCRAAPLGDRAAMSAEVIINATSVGMHPKVDDSPLPDGTIRPGQLVFDTVYNPVQTRLLQQADAAGARTVNGVAMFVRQAVAQFEWWLDQPAPAEVMRKIVLDRLNQHVTPLPGGEG